MDKDISYNDAYTLLNGMFVNQLPPMISQIMTRKSAISLYKYMLENKNKKIFKYKDDFISKLTNKIKPPKYIYGNNWAAESIKFFTLKKDNSWRPLAVPNIKHAIMFMYNSMLISESCLNRLYSKNERINGKTSHSESPIIEKNGMISAMLYDEIGDVENNQDGKYIGYNDTNAFFEENKLHRFNVELTYPYILQVDLSKFFENIYTHLLAQIDISKIFPYSGSRKLKQYLEWLDEYNQKINDNHTKGIIQGPISSKISAELFQISLDQLIDEIIQNNKLDIRFTRYVDDYRFYSRNYSNLDLMKNYLTKLFRKYELSFNDAKTKIYKGFEIPKQAHLYEYSQINNFIKGKNHIFSFKDNINIRESFLSMIENDDFPTIKAALTRIDKQICSKNIKFKDNLLILSLISFLIKLSYIHPIFSNRIYKLLTHIVNNVSTKNRHKIWKLLFNEMEYIEETFSGTDLEAWYFYLITYSGTSKETSKVFTRYKYFHKRTDMSVLILTVLLKPDSKYTNQRIEKYILQSEGYKRLNEQQISQSKWWLPIAKLWIVTDRNVNKKIRGLFVNRNGQIIWERLGIIEFLFKNAH